MTAKALITDAFAGVYPSSAQGLRGPIGASAAVSRTASVGVRITIVDIAGTDMRRIMPAVVIVGPIIGEIARSYRQVRPWGAATMLDLDHIVPGAFAGFQNGLPGGCGAPYNDGQQASHQHRCEQIPTTHEITSHSSPCRVCVSPLTTLCAATDHSVTKSPNDEERVSRDDPLPNGDAAMRTNLADGTLGSAAA